MELELTRLARVTRRILLGLIFLGSVLCQQNFESLRLADNEADFVRLQNDFAVGNVSTTTEMHENLTVTAENMGLTEAPPNKTDGFRPSMHLGSIEEFQNPNPFNSLEHIRFDNHVSVNSNAGNDAWRSVEPRQKNEATAQIGYGNSNGANVAPTKGVRQNSFETENSGNLNFASPYDGSPFKIPASSYQGRPSALERPIVPSHSAQEPYFGTANFEKPPLVFEKPSKFHGQNNFVTPFSHFEELDYGQPPYFGGLEKPEPLKFPPTAQDAFVRTPKFPYKFHQEPVVGFRGTSMEHYEVAQTVPTILIEKRVSPWKKIIHLIGTFLPLGFLLASLSPNIIKVGNTTQSNIALSKLRNLDLSAEHKKARMEDLSCEEQSICEMILDGSKPKSTLLKNVLWNFAIRTTEEAAKENGLYDVFNAVKKKNCSLVRC